VRGLKKNLIPYLMSGTLLTFSALAAADCSDIAGDWQGNWSEVDCYGEEDTGTWTGQVTSSCQFTGGDAFDSVTGTVDPSTKIVTATGTHSFGCGSIAVTGTFVTTSVSGSYSYFEGGGGIFSGTKQVVDTDGDGVPDDQDAFPANPSEWVDTDSDGTGDNADTDDDNDGVPDSEDDYPLGRFDDVRPGDFAFSFVEALARSGVTSGCSASDFCPKNSVTRAQMAVFLERGMNGSGFKPPAATGNYFLDVSVNSFAANFIEQLFRDGITSGCGGNNYCPSKTVTRAQMAVFLLRAKHGASYTPPAPIGEFGDVDLSYWAVSWIEQLAAEGITSGCGGGNFCPNAEVTRAQMAVFLVRTFGL
jgi:hypothetical protein